jgi:glycosyltransferase involved in cell wall biosynthesis
MKISYAIPVCNEYKEIEYLLEYLNKHKREQDEVVVQCDQGNTTPEVYSVLEKYPNIKIIEFALNRDFAAFKNNLKDNCSGDYIFQIDADEYPEEYLMDTIEWVISNNPKTDIFWVPRINKVEGLTKEHINKWRWNVDQDGRVNFPDYQCRILKNVKRIKWKNKVHEVLTGHKTESYLPANDEFCIHHLKTIERQEHQNEFYNTL